MRCFQALTAIAVLICTTPTWGENNLPPAPKNSVIVFRGNQTPAKLTVEVADIVKDAGETPSVCSTVQDSPLPSVSGKVESAALPPVCKSQKSRCCKPIQPVKFLANEFLRKPVYAVEKAMNDAEAERLRCEKRRLEKQTERLGDEAKRLTEKARNACPHDLQVKCMLLKEEADYAAAVNDNALRQAQLECKQAEYCEQKSRLEAKHTELFPSHD